VTAAQGRRSALLGRALRRATPEREARPAGCRRARPSSAAAPERRARTLSRYLRASPMPATDSGHGSDRWPSTGPEACPRPSPGQGDRAGRFTTPPSPRSPQEPGRAGRAPQPSQCRCGERGAWSRDSNRRPQPQFPSPAPSSGHAPPSRSQSAAAAPPVPRGGPVGNRGPGSVSAAKGSGLICIDQ